ncbi:MAG TPA: polysaccharide deacetylase family protein [Pseudonocardiaceae bacterium]|nr:polysaccharide deacetylase family protein [Pseudonocardiaceae bacterium]
MTPYPWPDGKRAALCVTFDFDGESPFLWRRRNDMPVDIGELEQRRFGPRRGVYHVLEMLAQLEIRATFFVPGWIASEYRPAVAAVHAAGHELALHGWCHEPPGQLSTEELTDTLIRARDLLGDIAGRTPVGYRSPSFALTTGAFDVLAGLGVTYDSSLMGDDRPYRIEGLVEVPVDWATDDAVYYRYTAGDTRPPTPAGQLGSAWTEEITGALRSGSLVNLTMHPWLSGRPARIARLADLLAWARNRDDLWVGTVGDLAAHHEQVSE